MYQYLCIPMYYIIAYVLMYFNMHMQLYIMFTDCIYIRYMYIILIYSYVCVGM